MNKLLLIIVASLRTRLRWARQHVYAWLVLGPLVLAMTYATATRMTDAVDLRQLSLPVALLLTTAVEICLVGLSLSRATVELYHVRRPEFYFESLPVPLAAHLHAAIASRLARTVIAGIVIVIARSLFTGLAPLTWQDLPPLLLFVTVTALAEIFAALNWIHWGHTRETGAAAGAIVVLLAAMTLAGWLLALALLPDKMAAGARLWLMAAGGVGTIGLYLLVGRQHAQWRSGDVEYARRLQTTGRWGVFGQRFIGRHGPIVAAQLVRDLQLTLRAFSSAVYVVVGLTALWLIALFAVLTTDWLPPDFELSGWLDATWLPAVLAIKIVGALAATTLAALTPVLVAYELPHLWMERAIGTTGLDVWQAKLWYARLVSLPAPLIVWLVGMASGEAPLFYALPLLAECLWLWWLVSSIIGALCYEMPERAGLAVIVMATIGLAGGVFAAMLWPFGLIIYFQAMHSLTARGRERARYYLIVGDD